jgi:hypothetical protein
MVLGIPPHLSQVLSSVSIFDLDTFTVHSLNSYPIALRTSTAFERSRTRFTCASTNARLPGAGNVLGSGWWICVAPRLRGSGTHQQCGGNTQMHMRPTATAVAIILAIAIAGHTAQRTGTQGVQGRRKSADLKRPPRFTLR